MEGKKQMGSSSSSFTSDLFDSNEYSSSSMGIFGSIFAPSSPKVLGRKSLRSEVAGKKQDSANAAWNTKSETSATDMTSRSNEGENRSIPNKDMSSIYEEQRVQPCHLSSSIYYGGQDIYNHGHTSNVNKTHFKKDGTEDDTGSASRGNWWQGSLYY